jgi:hypothetical protein
MQFMEMEKFIDIYLAKYGKDVVEDVERDIFPIRNCDRSAVYKAIDEFNKQNPNYRIAREGLFDIDYDLKYIRDIMVTLDNGYYTHEPLSDEMFEKLVGWKR